MDIPSVVSNSIQIRWYELQALVLVYYGIILKNSNGMEGASKSRGVPESVKLGSRV